MDILLVIRVISFLTFPLIVFISRNVVFHNTIFPFQHTPNPNTPLAIFSNRVLPQFISDMSSHASSDSHPITIYSPSHSYKQRPHWTSKPPNYLQDYHYYLATHSNPHTSPPHNAYPISQFLSYDKLSFPYKSVALSISSHSKSSIYSKVALIPKW